MLISRHRHVVQNFSIFSVLIQDFIEIADEQMHVRFDRLIRKSVFEVCALWDCRKCTSWSLSFIFTDIENFFENRALKSFSWQYQKTEFSILSTTWEDLDFHFSQWETTAGIQSASLSVGDGRSPLTLATWWYRERSPHSQSEFGEFCYFFLKNTIFNILNIT